MKYENIKKEIRDLRIREMAWTINEIDVRMAKLVGLGLTTEINKKSLNEILTTQLEIYMGDADGNKESKSAKANSP